MPPRTTIWALDAHSEGKHLVLARYLQAWLPIMSRWNEQVLFIDGFAGPGEYIGDKLGSPVIALKTLAEHRARHQIRNGIEFLFIEKDVARYEYLKQVLTDWNSRIPHNCTYRVINGNFSEKITGIIDNAKQRYHRIPPMFVMIDPFGISETPMSTIASILENPKSEAYISFMYREINRFKGDLKFEKSLDNLYGCPDWRNGLKLAEGKQQKEFFYNLYASQLKKNGAKYVVYFELYQNGELVYTIFFATSDLKGCDKMKEAIWKVIPSGNRKFQSNRIGQLALGDTFLNFSLLEETLLHCFESQDWQTLETVKNFVSSDMTHFHSRHLNKTLKSMKTAKKIETQKTSKDNTTMIRFIRQSSLL